MQITRTSIFSGTTRSLNLPITEQQLQAWPFFNIGTPVVFDIVIDAVNRFHGVHCRAQHVSIRAVGIGSGCADPKCYEPLNSQ